MSEATPTTNQVYDYLIVGSGSAGSVLAYRLSAAGHRVALVEAGSRAEPELVADPLAYGRFRRTRHDWALRTEPQAGTGGRSHDLPRGKLWGGCSSVNGMVYIRGGRADYDAWARAAGEEWDWPHVRAAFQALEASAGGLAEPLPDADRTVWHEAFLEACAERGLARSDSFGEGRLDGAGWVRLTMRSGRRHGAYENFLLPALASGRVDLHDEWTASRILFASGRAYGVECRRGSDQQYLRAEREVIVCCGAVNSPQLLLRSGIGSPDALRSLGIPVVSPLGDVGANLSDHLVTGVVFTADMGVPAGPTAVAAFAYSDGSVPDSNLQLWLNRRRHSAEGDAGDDSFTILSALVRPESRGAVRLAPDGTGRAVIDPGYLTEKEDLTALVAGVRLARELGAAAGFRWAHPVEEQPGRAVVGDDELAQFVRRSVSGQHHPMGTCRMGTQETAVVDPFLRVRGVRGLRVVDASVFPAPIGTGPDASTQMVGWRSADFILDTRGEGSL